MNFSKFNLDKKTNEELIKSFLTYCEELASKGERDFKLELQLLDRESPPFFGIVYAKLVRGGSFPELVPALLYHGHLVAAVLYYAYCKPSRDAVLEIRFLDDKSPLLLHAYYGLYILKPLKIKLPSSTLKRIKEKLHPSFAERLENPSFIAPPLDFEGLKKEFLIL